MRIISSPTIPAILLSAVFPCWLPLFTSFWKALVLIPMTMTNISKTNTISTSVYPLLFMASLIPDLLRRLLPMSGYPQSVCVGCATTVCSICEVDEFLNFQRARTSMNFDKSESVVTVRTTV